MMRACSAARGAAGLTVVTSTRADVDKVLDAPLEQWTTPGLTLLFDVAGAVRCLLVTKR